MAGSTDQLQSGIEGTIQVEFIEDFAILRMKRGENRINEDFMDKMNEALDEVESHSGIKALITTGSGKFFGNGLDLEWMEASGPSRTEDMYRKLDQLLLRFLTFPLPTIAAINGHAFAGGAIISLCHDYRVMTTQHGWWCLNEAHLGRRFQDMMLDLIRKKLTAVGVREAAVYGRRLTAEVALDYEIIHQTSEPSQLISTAMTLARQLTNQQSYVRQSLLNMKTDIWREKDVLAKL